MKFNKLRTLISALIICVLFLQKSYGEIDIEYLIELSSKSVSEAKILLESKPPNERAETALELSKIELNKRNISTAQAWLDYVLEKFPEDYSTTNVAWFFKAQLSWAQSNYNSFFIQIDNAIRASEKTENYDQLKHYIHLKAGNQHSIGMLLESRDTLSELMKIAEANSDEEAMMVALHESALLHYKMGNLKEAKESAVSASLYNLNFPEKNVHAQGMIEKTLGNIAWSEGQRSKAEDHFSSAIESFSEINNYHELGNCFYNRAHLKIDAKLFSDSITNLHEAIYNFTRSGSPGGVGMAHMTLGNTYLDLEKLDAAENHLSLAKFFNTRSNSQLRLAQTYTLLGELYNLKEMPEEALWNLSQSKRLYLDLGLKENAERVSKIIMKTNESF